MFVAAGNCVQVINLVTGLKVCTLRKFSDNSGKKSKVRDVHRSNIVMLSLVGKNLISVCSKGVVAKWDITQHHWNDKRGEDEE